MGLPSFRRLREIIFIRGMIMMRLLLVDNKQQVTMHWPGRLTKTK